MSSLLELANQLIAAGSNVVPIRTDGTKAPAVTEWKSLQQRIATPGELQTWFGAGTNNGIALVCGSVSNGLEILDFDEPSIFKPWGEAVKATGGAELLKRLVCVKTPSGGWHILYRCPDGIEGNQKLAQRQCNNSKIKTLIETRGDGGYVLTAGSPVQCHPTGKPYLVKRGELQSIPSITSDERDLLISCARSLNEFVPTQSVCPEHYDRASSDNTGTRPGDDFNLRGNWHEILTPSGWQFIRQIGQVEYLRKPGDRDPGHHATINHAGTDLLYVFSSSASPFEPERSYTKFQAYTLLNHEGDFAAAAKGLKKDGYGRQQQIVALNTSEVKAEVPDWSDPQRFGEPLLFGHLETPELKVDVLPSWTRNYVKALAANTQTPESLGTMLALTILAGCLQKRFEVAPYADNYKEPLSIWTLIPLPPGSKKTAVLQALAEPLNEWESEQATILKPDIDRKEDLRKIIENQIADLVKQAGKKAQSNSMTTKSRAAYMSEIQELRSQLPEPLKAPCIYITDTTPEGCRDFLFENDGRGMLLTDEAGIFEIMSGIYSDGKANLDVFLQGHAGGHLKVKRSGRSINIGKVALSMALAIQPGPLSELGSRNKRSFRDNGLLARFLYAVPKSNIGERDVRQRLSVPDDLTSKYGAEIKKLLSIPAIINDTGIEAPRILTLSADALADYQRFAQWIESHQGVGKTFESIQDFTAKLPGAALRIAGIRHVCEFGASTSTISKETLEPALDFCEKLITHAQAAFGAMGDDPLIADAKWTLRWLTAHAQSDEKARYFVNQNELHKSGRFKNSKLERLTKALEILRERNILSPQQKESTGGRPALRWYINPAVIQPGTSNGLA